MPPLSRVSGSVARAGALPSRPGRLRHARRAAARDLVLRAIEALDTYKHTVGFDGKEVAAMIGIPANTVCSRLRLAREAFRAAVSGERTP